MSTRQAHVSWFKLSLKVLGKNRATGILALFVLILSGCSKGTEVGNGAKPQPTPEPVESGKDTGTNQSPDSAETASENDKKTSTTASSEKDQDPKRQQGSVGSTKISNKIDEITLQHLLLNTCGSPWGSANLQLPLSLTQTDQATKLITILLFDSSSQRVLEWAGVSYGINATLGTNSHAVTVTDLSSSKPSSLGSTVQCFGLSKQEGNLLGDAEGKVVETKVELKFQDKTYYLYWYQKSSGSLSPIRLVRITLNNNTVVAEFKN